MVKNPARRYNPAIMVNARSILIFVLYFTTHIVLLWMKPLYYMKPMEIGLQLLVLLPLLLADLKRARASPAVEKRSQIPLWVLAGCVLTFAVGGLAVNRVVTAGRMGGGDESAYRFQARIFASGHVTTIAPPTSVEYTHHIIHAGRWFTKYPPGWPAVLAVASAIGLAAAINILFGAITLWIVFCMARRTYSNREAGLAMFLMVFSPFFFGNCLGHWSHPLCGCLLAGSAYFYFQAQREGTLRNVSGMLCSITAAILVRPLTGALFGVVLGAAAIWNTRRNRPQLLKTLALCGLFAVATICISGAYNHATTGDFTRFPYAMYQNNSGLPEVMLDVHAGTNLSRLLGALLVGRLLATWFFAFPLLFPVAAFAVWRDRERRQEAILLSALFLCLVVGYSPTGYSSGSSTGERYYFEGFFAMSLLAARGLVLLEQSWGATGWFLRWLGPLAASSLATLLFTLSSVFHEVAPYVEVRALAEGLTVQDAVVFLKPHDPEFIPKHFNLNRANWPAAPIFFAPDPGPANRQALVQALGRHVGFVIAYDPVLSKAQVSSVKFDPTKYATASIVVSPRIRKKAPSCTAAAPIIP